MKKTKKDRAPVLAAASPKTTAPTVVAPKRPATGWALPPADAKIPPVPAGFVGTTATLRGVKPRVRELNEMTQALIELRAFAGYDALFGATAPEREQLIANMEAARQWSVMRVRLADWDAVCATYEQLAWVTMRSEMKRLRPAFDLAAANKPSLTRPFSTLASFLHAMSEIGRKAVASRRANKAAAAEGKPPVRGRQAKAMERTRGKEALAKKLAAR